MADPVVAATVPSWVWAMLVMVLFVAVSAAAMWLVRYPLRHLPPGAGDNEARSSLDED